MEKVDYKMILFLGYADVTCPYCNEDMLFHETEVNLDNLYFEGAKGVKVNCVHCKKEMVLGEFSEVVE
ncbi:hypothetical protein HCA33_12405 [Listeria seeligeri]|uniref:hypothetical protein n=1 Tax=Listeria TaxID=1637 RepID=UPI00162AF2B3|nr:MULTISPECIES: hypothetical protein [Listeria]EIY6893202.1 hypothetical protein [Listeria monocytogenes]MBC1581574.1 hypothetical protein [Listeria seeligeri]MBC1750458.1 hypothetical protein [Listeria seeligeri]MBC1880812.1 hypothetical protein [Listeria seeligeri]MBC6122848.1 hypothetical protein [Listeria seeligeri]